MWVSLIGDLVDHLAKLEELDLAQLFVETCVDLGISRPRSRFAACFIASSSAEMISLGVDALVLGDLVDFPFQAQHRFFASRGACTVAPCIGAPLRRPRASPRIRAAEKSAAGDVVDLFARARPRRREPRKGTPSTLDPRHAIRESSPADRGSGDVRRVGEASRCSPRDPQAAAKSFSRASTSGRVPGEDTSRRIAERSIASVGVESASPTSRETSMRSDRPAHDRRQLGVSIDDGAAARAAARAADRHVHQLAAVRFDDRLDPSVRSSGGMSRYTVVARMCVGQDLGPKKTKSGRSAHFSSRPAADVRNAEIDCPPRAPAPSSTSRPLPDRPWAAPGVEPKPPRPGCECDSIL